MTNTTNENTTVDSTRIMIADYLLICEILGTPPTEGGLDLFLSNRSWRARMYERGRQAQAVEQCL